MPHDFPAWQTVYWYLSLWRKQGLWQQINDRLRALVRQQQGRHRQLSAAIIDSQSVKTTERGGVSGYDAAKKVKGRKRHLMVDVLGLILMAVVHGADIQDRDGAKLLLERIKEHFSRLRLIWADGGYIGALLSACAGRGPPGASTSAGSTVRSSPIRIPCLFTAWPHYRLEFTQESN